MKRFWIRKVAGFIVIAIAGTFIFGSIVMLLWNALLPVLFKLPLINFWQALGLLILSKLLFGGFRGAHWGRHQLKNKMQEKFTNMTPEEREKFKQEWRSRCGHRFREDFREDKPAQ
jgi:hypothetical protein